MRRKYLSSPQLWLGCMCSLATLSEPTWGSPIVYAKSVGWGAEPAPSSGSFMPGVIFGAVLPDHRTKGTGWLVLARGVGDDSGTDSDSGDDDSGDDSDDDSDDSDSVIDDSVRRQHPRNSLA